MGRSMGYPISDPTGYPIVYAMWRPMGSITCGMSRKCIHGLFLGAPRALYHGAYVGTSYGL